MSEFLLKSAISMAALFLLYKLFLEKEKMHRFNRFYLLFSLLFSLCLPFVTIPIYVSIPVTPIQDSVLMIHSVTEQQPVINSVAPTVVVQPEVNYTPYIIWGLYCLITLLLVIRFAINITRFYRLKKRNQNIPYEGATLVLIDNNILPHTFLNTVYVNKEEYENQAIEPELYSHELTHVKQRHTLDILLIELLKTILWFNPLLYFYKKAIQLNHEFLADENVIHKNDIISYQRLLLNRSQQRAPIAMLASNLNFPITKKRFVMMTKTTPKLRAALLQISTLPIITALILLLCTQANAQEPQLSDEAVTKLEKFRVTDTEIKQFQENNPKAFSDNPEVAFENTEFTFTDKKGNTVNKEGYANLNEAQKEMVKLSPVKGAESLSFTENQEIKNPEYPGGNKVFSDWFNSNFKTPDYTESVKVTVSWSYTIDTNGSIINIKAEPSSTSDTLTEADLKFIKDYEKALKKTLSKSKKWKPGEIDGKPVKITRNFKSRYEFVVSPPKEVSPEEKERHEKALRQIPQFPGGDSAFIHFLVKNLKHFYVNDIEELNNSEPIYIFTVNKNGTLSDIRVENSGTVNETVMRILPEIEKDFKQLMKRSPTWTPAMPNGEPITAERRYPFSYKMVCTDEPKKN